jgi:type IV secretion system protein VirD4
MDRKHDRELSAVVSTAQSHTHFLDSPRMEAVLGRSTFDPSDLRPGRPRHAGHVWGVGDHALPDSGDGAGRLPHPGPLSVYLLLPPDRLDAFSRWLRLSVATTISALARLGPLPGGAPPSEKRALFLLDEFAQLGPMPPVRRAVSLMAGYGLQVWPFLQDLGQLRRLYRDWESFVANSDVVQAFGTTDQFTAEYLSKMAGTATVFHQSQSSGRSRGKHSSRSSSAGATETGRPLVTPDELRRLGRNDQVLLVRGEDPVLARRIAYYNDPTFSASAKEQT